MKINSYGNVILSEIEILNGLYNETIKNFENILTEDKKSSLLYNKSIEENFENFDKFLNLDYTNISIKNFDKNNQSIWFLPDEYKNYDVKEYLLSICPTKNIDRLKYEINLYEQYNLLPVLKLLKYLIDTMRKNDIVWGVGRGSSVASYVLYLLGVHKIDSVKYNLDITDFFK
jgi:DNA polymerase III alpha subunit